ncbi:ATP synthase F1 subunit epsilon [Jatrophihabitans sp. YIM 134969]
MATMHVELVSIERALWSGEATAVNARTVEGDIGVLPGHELMIAALAPGYVVRIDREGEEPLRVAVHGGFLAVREGAVSVLAETAEPADEIDVARARDALQRAEGELASDADSEVALAARDRARARLRAAGEEVSV